MRVRTKGTPSGRLGEAKAKLARWRAGCWGPGRIPVDLWRLAAEAAADPFCTVDEPQVVILS
jgi:hypothetical protein